MKRLLVVLLILGCQKETPLPGAAGPAEAIQDFAAALQKQDAASAWALLSSKTQAEANKLAPGGDGRAMLFTSALFHGPIVVAGVQQSGDSAEVRTSSPDGGAGANYRAVREADRWRVDLDLQR